ncbi:MAG: hypothetical protein R3Y28_05645 [Candidatus Gastranaerophilales bacterium]
MKISTIGKYIDQPLLLDKLEKNIPKILIGSGTGYALGDSILNKKNKSEEQEKFGLLKSAIVLSSTIAASLIAARGLKINNKEVIKGILHTHETSDLIAKQTKAVDKYINSTGSGNRQINNRQNLTPFTPMKPFNFANPQHISVEKKIDESTLEILNKAKSKHISLNDIEKLQEKLPENEHKKSLFNSLFKGQHCNHTEGCACGHDHGSWDGLKKLSLLGLVPVVAGVTSGIAADKVTGTDTKEKSANKIKEGLYQFIANIFLCNVGAAAALMSTEQLAKHNVIKPLSQNQKLGVTLGGIVTFGVLGGSVIANKISQNFIDPLFCKDHFDKPEHKHKPIFAERKPEALDVALHVDDIAAAGFLAGFRWVEPVLPFLYFISGYRAGIGYRNGHSHGHRQAETTPTAKTYSPNALIKDISSFGK